MDLPEGFAESIGLTQEELAPRVRLMAALKMFELGQISSGKAAELGHFSPIPTGL